MGESLIERHRVQDEGLRVVNCGSMVTMQMSAIRKEVGNYVPAPAVIRRPRALSGFIGRKERVGGFARPSLKAHGLTVEMEGIRQNWRRLEVHRTHGVGVKSVDIVRNTKGEGSALGPS